MNKLLKIDNPSKIKDARRIVDLRNYIIHAYDQVEAEILWGIIINKLPRLKDDVKSLLGN